VHLRRVLPNIPPHLVAAESPSIRSLPEHETPCAAYPLHHLEGGRCAQDLSVRRTSYHLLATRESKTALRFAEHIRSGTPQRCYPGKRTAALVARKSTPGSKLRYLQSVLKHLQERKDLQNSTCDSGT